METAKTLYNQNNTLVYEAIKPYVNIEFIDINQISVEVIDGFATGMVHLVKDKFLIDVDKATLILERQPAPSFNYYFKEDLEINTEKLLTFEIIITESGQKIYQTTLTIK
ncbi:MAG: hypothetical protein ACK4K9_07485 [Bacteroidia bacterium]